MLEIYFFEDRKNKYTKPDFSFLGSLIAKSVYAKHKDIPSSSVIIEKTENGKPYFKGEKDFFFNVSHSKNCVTVAFSDREIGIDIEKLREFDTRVANRYFNEEELCFSNNDNKKCFEIWTKKESSIKEKGLTLKSLKSIKTDKAFTFTLNDFIVSVCSENYEHYELFILESTEVAVLLENSKML